MRTHICLCPCECSQLEPLCIHRYTQKYTYIILQILFFYVNPCCENSHMSVPLRVLALRTSLHTYMCSQVYIYSITDTFVYEPMLCKLTCVCNMYPCECSRLERHCIHRPIHTYTHKYTYIKNHITDTLVYQPVLCTLTLVCALTSAHT